jgi:MbtH protein
MSNENDGNRIYVVLQNDEGQYSLWPKGKSEPPGWQMVGMEGSKVECSKYVDSKWVDMRPVSLRKAMRLH